VSGTDGHDPVALSPQKRKRNATTNDEEPEDDIKTAMKLEADDFKLKVEDF
jgi:hypothetical protein